MNTPTCEYMGCKRPATASLYMGGEKWMAYCREHGRDVRNILSIVDKEHPKHHKPRLNLSPRHFAAPCRSKIYKRIRGENYG